MSQEGYLQKDKKQALMMMQKEGYICALFLELRIDVAAMEDTMEALQNLKTELQHDPLSISMKKMKTFI